LNIGRVKAPQSYCDDADAIFALRKELNGVVRELHMPRIFGFSIFEAISRVEQYTDYPDVMTFSSEQIKSLTPQVYSRWEDLCDKLSTAGLTCDGVYNHSLKEYKNSYYKQSEKSYLEENLQAYKTDLSEIEVIAKQVSAVLHLGEMKTYTQYKTLSEMCSYLKNTIRIPTAVLRNCLKITCDNINN
jgi:hypothetical protein